MQRSERRRIQFAFGLLGAVFLALVGRVIYLQVWRASPNLAYAQRQSGLYEALPSPRGTIIDRAGRLLAYDRPVLEVRAEWSFDISDGGSRAAPKDLAQDLAGDLLFALGPNRPGQTSEDRRKLRKKLEMRITSGRGDPLRARNGQQTVRRKTIDFLVSRSVESAQAIVRLREIDRQRQRLHLHFIRRYERTHPYPELTLGVVGFVGEIDLGDGRSGRISRQMEAFVGLRAGESGSLRIKRDARGKRYWTGEYRPADAATVLQCTLDLDLQKVATDELTKAVRAVQDKYGSPPQWGAMCLAKVETGEILALASYSSKAGPKLASFAPTQNLFPPGSVVKPLVASIALERGVLDWQGDRFDCTPNAGGHSWYVPNSRRKITDEHLCGILSPREIIAQSSNIGATQIGLLLGREGLTEYLEHYCFGEVTGTGLLGEKRGVRTRDILTMPERKFWIYSAPSLSIGYEYNITPVQLLRAYVALASGRKQELALARRIQVDGRVYECLPAQKTGQAFLEETTRTLICDALAAVVSDDPNVTGRAIARELSSLGFGYGTVGGKTGTSEFKERRKGVDGDVRIVDVRTSSFAGFAPVTSPQFVAVCTLQKDQALAFWGGRYAGPAAARLLTQAMAWSDAEQTAPSQMKEVSSWDSGNVGGGGQTSIGATSGR